MHFDSPTFLITIDTECDNGWERPRQLTTRNSRFLPRFQGLCERYGFRPTWLVNYEMANCPVFQEFGRDVVARDVGEIGMHLHAWSSPPHVPLTDDDMRHHPYLIEFPLDMIREKIFRLTDVLENRFERKMLSHRAGRWALNAAYARFLTERGYVVDCSVTPHVDWSGHLGDPRGAGGVDYTWFQVAPYFVDLDAIDRSGSSTLLELPMSIVPARFGFVKRLVGNRPALIRRAVGRLARRVVWFRPGESNRNAMLAMAHAARAERWPYLQFMLHSTELMPGGSPTFRTDASIEALYDDLECIFSAVAEAFLGATLAEFHDQWTSRMAVESHSARPCLVRTGAALQPFPATN